MARRSRTPKSAGRTAAETVTSIKYSATRKNIPLAGLESHGRVREAPPLQYQYNPHLPPVLRSSPDAAATDRLAELLAEARHRALSEDEAKVIAEAEARVVEAINCMIEEGIDAAMNRFNRAPE